MGVGHKRRIQATWDRATPMDRMFGQMAYATYHEGMRRFASFYGAGFVQTTEAFVALSPNNDYHGNLRSLSAVLYAWASGQGMDATVISTYKACGRRAYSYVSGEASFLDTVGGPKITAFRDNILYREQSRRVTVDGHMVCVWVGRNMTMKEASFVLKSRALYAQAEQDFVHVARALKVPPCVLQATLWAARKRELGVRYSEQGELFSGESRWVEYPRPEDYPPYQMEEWLQWCRSKRRR